MDSVNRLIRTTSRTSRVVAVAPPDGIIDLPNDILLAVRLLTNVIVSVY